MSSSDLGSTKHPRIRRKKIGGGGIDKTDCLMRDCRFATSSPTLQEIKDFHTAKGAVFWGLSSHFCFKMELHEGLVHLGCI